MISVLKLVCSLGFVHSLIFVKTAFITTEGLAAPPRTETSETMSVIVRKIKKPPSRKRGESTERKYGECYRVLNYYKGFRKNGGK